MSPPERSGKILNRFWTWLRYRCYKMKVVTTELQGNTGLTAKVRQDENKETPAHPVQIAVLDREVALTRKEAWQFVAGLVNVLRETG